MNLVEREAVFEDLNGYWLATTRGSGCFVLLGGEAGVGKTSVIRAFAERVVGDFPVLIGHCDPVSTPHPLGPVLDMIDQGKLPATVLAGSNQREVFGNVLEILRSSLHLVIVEDVHWADNATLDLLRFVSRRVGHTQSLIVVTYRHDEIGRHHPLRAVLGELAHSDDVRRLRIEPLSRQVVNHLALKHGIDGSLLFELTGGNPFFVTEVLASGDEGVPETVQDSVLARVSRLSPAARNALDVASVVGASIEPDYLRSLVGNSAAIAECLSSGMLREAPDSAYEFRHELARQVVLSEIPASDRTNLHGKMVELLHVHPDFDRVASRLAYHAEESGNSHLAFESALRALDVAARIDAFREAAEQAKRALRFVKRVALEDEAEIWEKLASYSQDPEVGNQAHLEAARLWREGGNATREANTLAELSYKQAVQGHGAEGQKLVDRAVELIRDQPDDLCTANVWRLHAHVKMLSDEFEHAVRSGHRAIGIATRICREDIVAAAQNSIGSACLLKGEIEEGRRWLERSRDVGSKLGIVWIEMLALINLGELYAAYYRFREAREPLQRSLELSLEYDLSFNQAISEAALAQYELRLGNWADTAALLEAALPSPGLYGIARIVALVAAGRLRARRGDPDVWNALDEAQVLTADVVQQAHYLSVVAARSEAAWLSGELAAASKELDQVDTGTLKYHNPWELGELFYWRWKVGELAGTPVPIADPYRSQIEGRWQDAAEQWDALGMPYERAMALFESVDVAALKEAHQIFTKLGAEPMIARVTKALRKMGAVGIPRGPRPTTLEHPFGLTNREMDVLGLIASGKRNADIASELFLSPKTVEHHVTSIYSKLDVRSRMGAVQIARDFVHVS